MQIDWSLAKRITLWHYDDLVKKLLDVLGYGFVQVHYNHTMEEAVGYARKIMVGYLGNRAEAAWIDEVGAHFQALERYRIKDYRDLVDCADTKSKCEAFIRATGFEFDALLQVMNYLLRWVLPFRCTVKELLDTIPNLEKANSDILKAHAIRSNLDVLERLRTRAGRASFSRSTGMEETFLLALVHRADISRLAYVRGKTIKHLCAGGYDTLETIASADLNVMEADMTSYYESIGKRYSDFKSVIPLDWMVGGARILPRLVDTY